MGKLEVIDGKQTKWEGLWWHPEYNGFSSSCISLSELRKFKGKVRLYVRKNRFFSKDSNRPNYCFCLKDADSEIFHIAEVENEKPYAVQDENGDWYTSEGERLYTRDDARAIINGTFDSVRYGISDPYDILPEDFA